MKTKEAKLAVVESATNSVLNKKFLNEVGHHAVVSRSSVATERTAQLREVLSGIAEDLLEVGAVPKGMTYLGSAAVHIYKAEALGEVAYFSQLSLDKCPEEIAGPAVSDLRGAMLVAYGHGRQKKRSGF